MALRGAKREALLSLDPDLAVLQECGERDTRALEADGFQVLWMGANPAKGIAVAARKGITLAACHDPELAYFLPVTVRADEIDLRLLAIWAFNGRAKTSKRWPLNESLVYYESFLSGRPTIAAGDFNNHTIWDTPRRPVFRRSLDFLHDIGLRSVWHEANGCEHGSEECGTFYWYGHEHRPYHIDYCFASADLAVGAAEVGSPATWLGLSDHCPLVVDLRG